MHLIFFIRAKEFVHYWEMSTIYECLLLRAFTLYIFVGIISFHIYIFEKIKNRRVPTYIYSLLININHIFVLFIYNNMHSCFFPRSFRFLLDYIIYIIHTLSTWRNVGLFVVLQCLLLNASVHMLNMTVFLCLPRCSGKASSWVDYKRALNCLMLSEVIHTFLYCKHACFSLASPFFWVSISKSFS